MLCLFITDILLLTPSALPLRWDRLVLMAWDTLLPNSPKCTIHVCLYVFVSVSLTRRTNNFLKSMGHLWTLCVNFCVPFSYVCQSVKCLQAAYFCVYFVHLFVYVCLFSPGTATKLQIQYRRLKRLGADFPVPTHCLFTVWSYGVWRNVFVVKLERSVNGMNS